MGTQTMTSGGGSVAPNHFAQNKKARRRFFVTGIRAQKEGENGSFGLPTYDPFVALRSPSVSATRPSAGLRIDPQKGLKKNDVFLQCSAAIPVPTNEGFGPGERDFDRRLHWMPLYPPPPLPPSLKCRNSTETTPIAVLTKGGASLKGKSGTWFQKMWKQHPPLF